MALDADHGSAAGLFPFPSGRPSHAFAIFVTASPQPRTTTDRHDRRPTISRAAGFAHTQCNGNRQQTTKFRLQRKNPGTLFMLDLQELTQQTDFISLLPGLSA
jgi:hypothetical protein